MSEPPGLTIRRAHTGDAGLLAELGARTFAETFARDNSPEDMAAYLDASFNLAQQLAELADPASTLLIAEVGGAPVGLVVDSIGDRLETMLRPAAGILKTVNGISGTTVLGDGSVVMVLDLEALIE